MPWSSIFRMKAAGKGTRVSWVACCARCAHIDQALQILLAMPLGTAFAIFPQLC